jgi:hypothetical protein
MLTINIYHEANEYHDGYQVIAIYSGSDLLKYIEVHNDYVLSE